MTIKLTTLGEIAYRFGVQTPSGWWQDAYRHLDQAAQEGHGASHINGRVEALQQILDRFYEFANTHTKPATETDTFEEAEHLADHDGDWQQMVYERIAGLKELLATYARIKAEAAGLGR